MLAVAGTVSSRFIVFSRSREAVEWYPKHHRGHWFLCSLGELLSAGIEGRRAHGVFVRPAFYVVVLGGARAHVGALISFFILPISISEKLRGRVEGFAWKHCCLPCLRSL